MFPLLRPDCAEFDSWLDAQDPSRMTEAMVEEGEDLLPPAERQRITRAHAKEFPELWQSLIDDLGDEDEAERIVLAGTVVAALQEPRTIDSDVLELIEEQGGELRDDPAELLALVVHAVDLWSVADASDLDEALALIPDFLDDDAYDVLWHAAIEFAMRESWSARHERRLARLVRRVEMQLENVERPAARDLLTEACAAFHRDQGTRRRLASLLLADSVDCLPTAEELNALAA
jgi:hypothetical protein